MTRTCVMLLAAAVLICNLTSHGEELPATLPNVFVSNTTQHSMVAPHNIARWNGAGHVNDVKRFSSENRTDLGERVEMERLLSVPRPSWFMISMLAIFTVLGSRQLWKR